MPQVAILGGGLAGMAAASALGEAGWDATVYEMRAFAGGRAASYSVHGTELDNSQHILLRCCTSLIDFYRLTGVEHLIRWHREFTFIEPGGRRSTLRGRASFFGLRFLDWRDKLGVVRALLSLGGQRRRRDLDRITMAAWLAEQRQTPRAVDRFWRPVLKSAINEDLERMAAAHGFQVLWTGFLAGARNSDMGVAEVPLSELYRRGRFPGVTFRWRQPVTTIETSGERVTAIVAGGERITADAYLSALPCHRLAGLIDLELPELEYAPITGIHLWFDRAVTGLPHAALLDRTIDWFYAKDGGRRLSVVVSASRGLLPLTKPAIVELALRELAEFLPGIGQARLERAHVVKEVRATFSAAPGLEERRPGPVTRYGNLFLAGDWTRTGWPATMEGAVRSGYSAAAALLAARR